MREGDQHMRTQLSDALRHLESAIELLDAAGAPGQIAAHADLALNQLQDHLGKSDPDIIPSFSEGEDHKTVGTPWRQRLN